MQVVAAGSHTEVTAALFALQQALENLFVRGIKTAASDDVQLLSAHGEELGRAGAAFLAERSPGAATAPLPRGYQPRRPETTAFYRVIADHLETMLQDARERSPHGFGLPRHVESSFRRLLDCGIVERGFARVVCPSCRYEILVPFSCKTRGLCPSCDGRRMASGAVHLVESVLPLAADYRQWTLSFPRWLRIRLLRDKALVSEVLLVFVRVVSAYHRRRARQRGVAGGETGAVTAIQFAGSFANANVHFHSLVPEGVWHEQPDGSLGFHPLPPPTDEGVEEIAVRIAGVGRARRSGGIATCSSSTRSTA